MLPRFEQDLNLESWPDVRLPISLLTRYLFFLARRPISKSNSHYMAQRLNGLKSLQDVLRGTDIPPLKEGLKLLDTITPANFHRFNEQFQFLLLPLAYAADTIPSDVIASNSPPPFALLGNVSRILILSGPAIGIGDEAILFPLPCLIKANNPNAHIAVLSAYPGLWDRVKRVDQRLHYSNHFHMLQALRGQAPFDGFDLVILADFERPSLYASISHEAKINAYIELSLGTQSLFVVDNQHRWLHRAPQLSPYFANYYSGFKQLTSWLGLLPSAINRFSEVLHAAPKDSSNPLHIYVNPFTSKYDPSESYWSRLLTALLTQMPKQQIQLVLEPGPNLDTKRFASALMRSIGARTSPNSTVALSESKQSSSRQLQDVLAQMECSDFVICADSFAAHLAPLLGCTTIVLAYRGLENWRVPCPSSYYFGVETPLEQVILGIQQILADFGTRRQREVVIAPLSEVERQLQTVTQKLQKLLEESPRNSSTICEMYRDFRQVYWQVTERLSEWPLAFSGLLNDYPYEKPLPPLPESHTDSMHQQTELALHVEDIWQQWQNTNLRKYIGLVLGEGQ